MSRLNVSPKLILFGLFLIVQGCTVHMRSSRLLALASSLNGSANKLVFTNQPGNISAGSAQTTLHVAVTNGSGTVMTGDTSSVTLSIYSNPSSGTLLGTVTAPTVNGVASFSSISVDKVGNGYTLQASNSDAANIGVSDSFDVSAGAAGRLAFLTQPANAQPLTPMGTVEVQVEDLYGNAVSANVPVHIGLMNNPSGFASIGGSITETSVNGIATFSNLNVDLLNNGYTLSATSSSLNAAVSGAFNVTSTTVLDEYTSVLTPNFFMPQAAVTDSLGNLYVAGVVQGSGMIMHWLVKKWSGGVWTTIGDLVASNDTSDTGFIASMAIDESGNLYVGGEAGYDANSDSDWIVWKFDGTNWTESDNYTESTNFGWYNSANSIASDSLGNIYASGGYVGFMVSGAWIVRMYSAGTWTTIDDYQYTSNQSATAVGSITDSSGNLYVVGSGSDGTNNHWIVRKYNGSSWTTLDDYQGPDNTTANASQISIDSGNLYVSGTYNDNSGVTHQMLRKYNGTAWSILDDYEYAAGKATSPVGLIVSSGTVTLGSQATDSTSVGHAVLRQYQAGVWNLVSDYQYTAGQASSLVSVLQDSSGALDEIVSCVDGSGKSHWVARTLKSGVWSVIDDSEPKTGNFTATAIASGNSGVLYTAGYFANASFSDVWTVRQYAAGAWTTIDTYTGIGSSVPKGVAVDSLGNVYVSGHSGSNWITRMYSGGVWTTIDNYTYSAGQISQAQGVATDSSNNVYVVGYGTDSSSNWHWLVRKYSSGSWTNIADIINASATAVTVNTDGSIVVVGSIYPNWTVERYLAGSWTALDTYSYPSSISQAPTAIAHDGSGNLYVVGAVRDGSSVTHWIVRSCANGGACATSDDFIYPGGSTSAAAAVSLDSSNNVYVSGSGTDASNISHWLVRELPVSSSWSTIQDYQMSPGDGAAAVGSTWDSTLGKIVVTGSVNNDALEGTFGQTGGFIVTQTVP